MKNIGLMLSLVFGILSLSPNIAGAMTSVENDCRISPEFESKMSKRLQMPLKKFMLMTMALRDSSRPEIERELSKLNVHEDARALAIEMTDNDLIGEYLSGSIGLDQAIAGISEQAVKTVFSPKEYFKMQMLFYTADAGSDSMISSREFEENGRTLCIIPNAEKFKSLGKEFNYRI